MRLKSACLLLFLGSAPGTGLTFALVRTGCFIAGCDYGLPTAHACGVRFPPGSLAALDHARRGFVPPGAPGSLCTPRNSTKLLICTCARAPPSLPCVRR